MSEHALRHQLWLNHGHRTPAALYGDDGEMQCHACHRDGHPWDYKRAPLVELVPAALREIDTLRAQLAAARAAAVKVATERGTMDAALINDFIRAGRAQAIAEVKALVDRLSYEPADAYSSPAGGQGVVDAGLLRVKLDALASASPATQETK